MCGRPRGAPVRRVRWPTNEYEYDGVWIEACARELSLFPTTTGAPLHQFHTYINQQDGVLAASWSAGFRHAHFRLELAQFGLSTTRFLYLWTCGFLGIATTIKPLPAVDRAL